jgi:hypothetical protein
MSLILSQLKEILYIYRIEKEINKLLSVLSTPHDENWLLQINSIF